MKLAITYLLLFAYSTIILKPILPYTSDTIAHIFWYKDHMASVHSHEGKLHVHKEVIEAAKSSSPEKDSTILKKGTSATDHIITKELNIVKEVAFMSRAFFSLSTTLPHTFLSADYPPPKV